MKRALVALGVTALLAVVWLALDLESPDATKRGPVAVPRNVSPMGGPVAEPRVLRATLHQAGHPDRVVERRGEGWTVDGQPADRHRVESWLAYALHPPGEHREGGDLVVGLDLEGGVHRDLGLACGTPSLLCTRLATSPDVLVGAPLLPVSVAEITAVRIEDGDPRILARAGQGWTLDGQPLREDNDGELVARYLSGLRPPSVALGAPEAFEPVATVTVESKKGNWTLSFGAALGELVPVAVGERRLLMERYQTDPLMPGRASLQGH